jgi:hypothetical protein
MKPKILFLSLLCAALTFAAYAQEEAEAEKKKVTVEPAKDAKLQIAGGEEFSTAVGTASVVEVEGKRVVQVDFDLSDGVYLSAGYPVDLKRKFKTITFKAKSESPCGFALRVIDESGECFQFKFDNKHPGKEQDLEADLAQEKIECWGGDLNKKIDQPVKALHFVVSKREAVEIKGSAVFSEVTFKR